MATQEFMAEGSPGESGQCTVTRRDADCLAEIVEALAGRKVELQTP